MSRVLEMLAKPIHDGRRARGTCEPVVFWLRKDGDLMMAPHTDCTPLPGYQKVECTTVREIEKWSRKLAEIEEFKMRKLKIEELLRAKPEFERRITNCRLRLAKGCISDADEAYTRNTMASFQRKLDVLVKLAAGGIKLTEGALTIERREETTGMALYNRKKVSL